MSTGKNRHHIISFRYFLVLITLALLAAACTASATGMPWKFRSDLANTGVYDDGGTRPGSGLIWNFSTGDRVYSSPAVVDGTVYVGSDDTRVYALDAMTGEEIWNFSTGGRVISSPAVLDGVVYIGSFDQNLYALDAATGTKLWNFSTGGWVGDGPAVLDGVVYIGALNDRFYAIDAINGTSLWNVSFGQYPSIDSSPAIEGGTLFVAGGYNSLYALNVSDGAQIWNFTDDQAIFATPAVADGLVYIGTGNQTLYALDASDGGVAWAFQTEGIIESSAAVADGVVYFGSGDNKVYALNAQNGEELWHFTAGDVVFSSPAVANGVVYAGSWGRSMYALDATDGTLIWNFTAGSVIFSSPAVVNGTVYFGSLDGGVYAVGAEVVPPVANFSVNRTSGVPPFSVQFTDTSTGTQPLAYFWEFGDGTNSTEQNPVHNYTSGFMFWPKLTVTNSAGISEKTIDDPIIVVIIVGGDHGYYQVHCNVDGARVYLDEWYEGLITNGTLTIQYSTTGTPVRSFTVEKEGYQTYTAPVTVHPGKDQTVDLYAELVPFTGFSTNLTGGWNLFSTPIMLEENKSTWEDVFSTADRQNMTVVLGWDGAWFIPAETDPLHPLDAWYVKVDGTAKARLTPSAALTPPPSRDLGEGLCLIGPAPAYLHGIFPAMPLDQALISIEQAPGGKTGYVMVVSPALNQPGWAYARGGTIRDLLPFKGYWVVMENPDTLYGFSTTPVTGSPVPDPIIGTFAWSDGKGYTESYTFGADHSFEAEALGAVFSGTWRWIDGVMYEVTYQETAPGNGTYTDLLLYDSPTDAIYFPAHERVTTASTTEQDPIIGTFSWSDNKGYTEWYTFEEDYTFEAEALGVGFSGTWERVAPGRYEMTYPGPDAGSGGVTSLVLYNSPTDAIYFPAHDRVTS